MELLAARAERAHVFSFLAFFWSFGSLSFSSPLEWCWYRVLIEVGEKALKKNGLEKGRKKLLRNILHVKKRE